VGEGEFASLARQHWLKKSKRNTKVKVKNDVLKREIWDAIEKDGFQFKSLLALEGLQTLERSVNMQPGHRIVRHSELIFSSSYLWPGYTEDSSNFHVLLIVLLANVKRRERLETWGKCPEHSPSRVSSNLTQVSSTTGLPTSRPCSDEFSP
jgi:intron-binding protein aquarius